MKNSGKIILDPVTSFKDELVELPSGLIVSETAASIYIKQNRRPIAIDLFAGAGGFSLGLIQAGLEVVAGVDNECMSAITYMHNLGTYPCQFHFLEALDEKRMEKALQKMMDENKNGLTVPPTAGSGWISHQPPDVPGVGHFFLGDIRDMTGDYILNILGLKAGDVDCVVGGPPCQGFSTAGKRNVMDPRNSLVFEFARLVCEIQPKTMVLENVPGMVDMVTPDGLNIVDCLCRIFEDGGFGNYKALLKCMEAQTGAVGLVKHRQREGGKKKQKKKKEKTLFDSRRGD